jgi:hypothetical protein
MWLLEQQRQKQEHNFFRSPFAFAMTNDNNHKNKPFNSCVTAEYNPLILQNPCSNAMKQQAPAERYSLTFFNESHVVVDPATTAWWKQFYRPLRAGTRAPVWADRVYNMARFWILTMTKLLSSRHSPTHMYSLAQMAIQASATFTIGHRRNSRRQHV